MRRTEIHHHTPEQVQGYLSEAERIVRELKLADKTAEIAYAKAIDLLAAKQIVMEQAGVVPDLARMGIKQ